MIIKSKFLFNSIYKKQINFYEGTIEHEVQALYCSAVDHIGFNKLKCNRCNEIGNFEIKGYYYRTIIINNKAIKIRITRIKCKDCNKTHAIFFLDFVPYYQLSTVNCNDLILVNFIDINYDELIIERLKKRVNVFDKFLLEIERKASFDSIVMIDEVEYEVPSKFAARRVKICFSHDFTKVYVLDNNVKIEIKKVNKIENSMTKRKGRLTDE